MRPVRRCLRSNKLDHTSNALINNPDCQRTQADDMPSLRYFTPYISVSFLSATQQAITWPSIVTRDTLRVPLLAKTMFSPGNSNGLGPLGLSRPTGGASRRKTRACMYRLADLLCCWRCYVLFSSYRITHVATSALFVQVSRRPYAESEHAVLDWHLAKAEASPA